MEIYTLDLHFQDKPHTIASYLVVGPDGPVLVETGPQSTLETLLLRLNEYGHGPEDIRHVLVTHIHLDHAGAAGWWARQGAQIYVHQVGAPHLIDPTKLLASAGLIYGDKMGPLWGEVLAAPGEQVTPIQDGAKIEVAGLTFMAWDTPGHAYHHHVYQVEDIAFTGDAAGIQLPGSQFVDLPAPPPEFNLELWRQTIMRLKELRLTAIYPTHFGRVDDWQRQLETLDNLLGSATEFIRVRMEAGLERDQILEEYLADIQRQTQNFSMPPSIFDQYEAANPHYMSVDGIMRYWRKKELQAQE